MVDRYADRYGSIAISDDHKACPAGQDCRVRAAALALMTRDDFWNAAYCKPGEYDTLMEALGLDPDRHSSLRNPAFGKVSL